MHLLNYASASSSNALLGATSSILRHFGHAGVDVFFVVSGFIIAHQVQLGGSPLRFLLRRGARIYPLFWLTLVVMAAIPLYPGKSDKAIEPITLLLFTSPTQHPVAWTLVFEVHFYAVTAICLMLGRRAPLALLIWCAIQAAAVVIGWPMYPFISPLSLEFCIGILVGFAASRVAIPWPRAVGLLAIATAAIAGLLFDGQSHATNQWWRLAAWGLPGGLLLWSALSFEAGGGRTPRLLSEAGNASYSIYMWHLPVAGAAWMIWRPALSTWWGATSYLIACLVTISIVSWLSWRQFEQPISRWFSAATRPRVAAVVAPSGATAAESETIAGGQPRS